MPIISGLWTTLGGSAVTAAPFAGTTGGIGGAPRPSILQIFFPMR